MPVVIPTKRYLRDLRGLSPQAQEEAIEALSLFLHSPRERWLNFETVTNRQGYWTIRSSQAANRSYRILLRQTGDDEYEAVAIGNHDYIYTTYFRRK